MLVRKIISKIPLAGNLTETKSEDHKFAAIELFLILAFSFLPVLVAIFGDYYVGGRFTPLSSVNDNIRNGELFLIVTSLMAPLFYILQRERKPNQRFPNQIAFMFIYIIIIVLVAISFAYQRSNTVNQEAIYNASFFFFGISLILNYIVLVYNNHLLPNASQKIREEEEDFYDKVSSRRSAE